MVRQKTFFHASQINVREFQPFCCVEGHQKDGVSLLILCLIALVEEGSIKKALKRPGSGFPLITPCGTDQLFDSGKSGFTVSRIRIAAFHFFEVADLVDQFSNRLHQVFRSGKFFFVGIH